MGSRPKDPNEEFAKRANSVVDQAIKQQRVSTQNLKGETGALLAGAPESYGPLIAAIGGASGRTFPQYVSNAESNFFGTADKLTRQGRRDLRNFDPDLIGSPSEKITSDYLIALGNMFSKEVQELGKSGRDRLFALPEQAQMAFTSSAMNPALNSLRDAQYMNFAKEPPTIANDASKMFRDLYNYSSV
jgi:hypothetical protein